MKGDMVSSETEHHSDAKRRKVSLWGHGSVRFLLTILSALSLADGFFVYLACGIYTYHMFNSGFDATFIAMCYLAGQTSRFFTSVMARYAPWYYPIICLTISSVLLFPVLIDTKSHVGMICWGCTRVADMLAVHNAFLGMLVDKRKGHGSALCDARRSSQGAMIITSLWTIGYSTATVLAGFIYQYYGLRPLIALQLIGFLSQISVHLLLCLYGYRWEESSAHQVSDSTTSTQRSTERSIRNSNPEPWTCMQYAYILLNVFFHFSPVVIWITFATMYESRFGIGPSISCIVQMVGDLLGSGWLLYKSHARSASLESAKSTDESHHISNAYSVSSVVHVLQRFWVFKCPRDVTTSLFLLALAMLMMMSQNLTIVIVGHVCTAIFYVHLTQVVTTGGLVYCADKTAYKSWNSYSMICVMICKIIGSVAVPLLYTMGEELPYLIVALISLIGGLVMAIIYCNEITNQFPGESYTRLSASMHKLQARKVDAMNLDVEKFKEKLVAMLEGQEHEAASALNSGECDAEMAEVSAAAS
eukprot:g981.t1